ncbi:hypothetical protein SARC_17676 [Sphaeroforma arctica JP610]|uniref:PH domain-containing protein n=1 Tax=Sphaeroforma arctica JP610 TaxID=667725 RepID=A0A0L0EZD9_9EUKA|nr:hypothetical protein SARC_17676 [Sphaeroforma arctica JP610]KNC69807.1 hypothetical protein SARC_17676 [Sphaeroforma arctica JP610]|eukprot:XP_014143709.1 hypothetical protein SARC_17676 [Sphaeroforma arctica JP610]
MRRSTEREEGLVRLQQVFDEKVMAVSKPRWCVLEGTTFSVYRSRDLTQHVGDVGLNSYCTVAYAAGADQSTLIVGTQDNPLYVRCVTTSDAERWYTAFETALNKCPNAKVSRKKKNNPETVIREKGSVRRETP